MMFSTLSGTGRAPQPNLRGLLIAAYILALATAASGADSAYALVYQVVDLGPANFAGSVGQGVNGIQQVGTGPLTDSSATHALLWSGTAGSCLDLNGTFGQSQAYATNGTQQAGYGTVSGNSHAVLWNGSGSSFVDLNPSGFTDSEAHGIDGTRQAGYGTMQSQVHALLWSGTAASVVDLHPPTASGFTSSYARSISGPQQAGYGFKSGVSRALLWSGTAASYVDLNPTGYAASAAYSNARSQQVGYAVTNTSQTHAMLWNGTAGSFVDLNPSGYANSVAWSTNGGLQVGYASDGTAYHAMLWRGTAASAVDLGQYLPSGLSDPKAYGVDAQGNVVGYAVDSFLKKHAILWQAVPGTWKGGGNNDWGDTTHWQSGTITTVPDGRGEPVVFGDFPYTGTIDLLSADRTVGHITFHSGVQSTIKSSGGKTLKLDNGAGFATVSVAGSHSITAPISLLSDMAVTTMAANDSLTISGAISGSQGVTKDGPGKLTLSGASTYSGGTTVSGGSLIVSAVNILPTGGSVTIGPGGTLVLQATPEPPVPAWVGGGTNDWATGTNWSTGSVPGGQGARIVVGNSGATGVVDLATAGRTVGQITFNSSAATTIKSSGAKTLTLDNGASAATLAVAGSHSITAKLALASDLSVNASAAGASLSVSGGISGAHRLTKTGAGTLTLSGADSYSGGTVVSGGKLVIADLNALPTGGSLTISAGGTLVLQSGLHVEAGLSAGSAAVAGSASAVEVVPEPGSLVLLGSLLAALIAWRFAVGWI
jgi:autotransporter-associated beta strand protein